MSFGFSGFDMSNPVPKAVSANAYEHADYSYEVIMERIKEFEGSLDDEHEVALMLASFGREVLLQVTEIGYSNPYTLVFYGFIGEQPATLVQHMSQLNLLLTSVRKQDESKPPRRIGFSPPTED